ncbi:DNA polymerase I [Treponema phagedenis]|uniref:DNA polymerase I n=1 Tax=Treponema phagedenis TaxID=162 RepID=UPI000465DB7A|nr:DNA polymerase I [Treponema phagedenis]NVP24097.1 DNA polymerase I [Treponema phagedenis]QKS93393.1 DNA polymerase I [Treponema phagedenis]QLC59620.1 DNA polymerase I [Treponema phagedenis]QSH96071.1 DNA polymerase I [Treponema phagedenis]
MKDDVVFILDAYGLIYRSYFAFVGKPLTNNTGKNISAVFGFFKSLYTILRDYEPQFFAVAMDSRVPTFRHEMYSEYKATRDKTPEDLHAQIPIIEEILTALGITLVRKDGFEADDVIASIAKCASADNKKAVIISSDKDLMQLIDDKITMLKPNKADAWIAFNADDVKEQWGVPPNQMLDFLSLIGDTADNVPGVKSIGPKTAAKLLDEYGSLDGIYAHTNSLKGAMQKKIIEGKENAYFSKKLIALEDSALEKCVLSDFACPVLDYAAAAKIFLREELPSLARQYAPNADFVKTDEAFLVRSADPKKEKKQGANSAGANPITTSPLQEIASASGGFKKNAGNYRGITEPEELRKLIDAAIAQGFAAFDCETTGLNPLEAELAGFSLALKAEEAFYIPVKLLPAELQSQAPQPMPLEKAVSELARLWQQKNLTIIMHNGKFDYQAMRTAGVFEKTPCAIFDTMIAAWLLDPDRTSFSLDSLASSLLKLQTIAYKDVVPKGKIFSDVPYEQAVAYAAEDADITLQFYEFLLPKLKEYGLFDLFQTLEMPLLPLLAEMEIAGIFLKKEELAEFSEELGKEIIVHEREIFDIVGHEFNIASPKQLQEVLFTELKLPTGKKTKTGYSTDTSVLEVLASEHVIPAKILEYRALTKLKSTYTDALPALADKNGRVHTSFIQTGTATGRLSSRDPNLQNIPIRDEAGRRIRKAFQAEKGKNLISADYAQIELVILAHLSQDKNLVQAFQEGTDVHAATAGLIFGVPIGEVLPDMRRIAKTINFGVMYGMSAFRLSNALRIPRRQAADFIETYFKTYSGVHIFMEELKESARRKGYVETLMGRRRYIYAINSANKLEQAGAERVAINTPIQGSAADIVKTAMLKVQNALQAHKLQAKLLLQVHDELICEAPEKETETVKTLLRQEMESVVKLLVPLRVNIESGKTWGDFH